MLTDLAKKLRKNQTDAERALWRILRAKQMSGIKFRRQEPVGSYIADFVCFSKKLIIELDGGQHADTAHQSKDSQRDNWFRGQGFTVFRFWNNEVLTNSEGVWHKIFEFCHPPLNPLPSREGMLPKPSPRVYSRGEGRERG